MIAEMQAFDWAKECKAVYWPWLPFRLHTAAVPCDMSRPRRTAAPGPSGRAGLAPLGRGPDAAPPGGHGRRDNAGRVVDLDRPIAGHNDANNVTSWTRIAGPRDRLVTPKHILWEFASCL